MASFNRITIVGYLGHDPETKYTTDGQTVCNFSVATTEKRKDRKGDLNEQTTWFRVAAFGKTAELCGQHLAKGSLVYVEGKLRLDEYTDRNGERRAALEVAASDVKFLSVKQQGEAEQQQQPQARATAAAPTGARGPVDRAAARAALKVQAPADFDDDDIPF